MMYYIIMCHHKEYRKGSEGGRYYYRSRNKTIRGVVMVVMEVMGKGGR